MGFGLGHECQWHLPSAQFFLHLSRLSEDTTLTSSIILSLILTRWERARTLDAPGRKAKGDREQEATFWKDSLFLLLIHFCPPFVW